MADKSYWISNGRTVIVEQLLWKSHSNSYGKTVMVEQLWWNSLVKQS